MAIVFKAVLVQMMKS